MGFSLILRAFFSFPNERQFIECQFFWEFRQYQLYMKSGVPKSTIGNIINCSYDSVKLRVIHEICQGLNIDIPSFFASPLFEEENLEP